MSNPSEPVRIEVESVVDAIEESEETRPNTDTIVVESEGDLPPANQDPQKTLD